jgi:replicative DNA helicase
MKNDIINRLETIISNQDADENQIIFQLKNLITENELQNSTIRDSRSVVDIVDDCIMALDNRDADKAVIKTGLRNFDERFGGFSPGEFVVIGGRPAMGKTQLLIHLALNIGITHPILYFSFDLSEFILVNRFLSTSTGISVDRILQSNLKEDEKKAIKAHGTLLANRKIFINDCSHDSIAAIKNHCLNQIRENDVKVIIIDYLQLMSSGKYRYNRELEISHISRELKNIAKDNNVCIIATSQLNRAVESRPGSKRPLLSDIRESGAIEQDADKVIFLYRPEYYGLTQNEEGYSTVGLMEVIVAKNRNGRLGTVYMKINSNLTSMEVFDFKPLAFTFSDNRISELGSYLRPDNIEPF